MINRPDPEILLSALRLLGDQYRVSFALFENTGFPEIDKKLHEARIKFADMTILLMQCKKIIEDDRQQNLMDDLVNFEFPPDWGNENN